MVSAELVHRIRWHAGLTNEAVSSVPSIAEATWEARGQSEILASALRDFLTALSRLNHELNGPVPSEAASATMDIPRNVAYAVAEVLRLLRDNDEASDAAWLVEAAWQAVLAGDIDDLEQHLVEERAPRE
jgi:hypothetical protein